MQPDPVSDTLNNTIRWFQLARPEPGDASFHTQLGCHLEEVGEMLECVSPMDPKTTQLLADAINGIKALGNHLKGATDKVFIHEHDKQDYLDAICDQIVTGTGCAHDQGYQLLGAMQEVNRGNWSKFVDGKPVFDANGKIAKGPSYLKPDLSLFV